MATETIESSAPSIPEGALEALAAALGGALILPDDPLYDDARHVWNGMIERHPAAIARCRTVDDVVAAAGTTRLGWPCWMMVW